MIERSATRFNKGDYFETVVDTEIPSCEVTGFIDGQLVDFSGGGGGGNFSIKRLTVKNGESEEIPVPLFPTFGNFTLYDSDSVPVVLNECLYVQGELFPVVPSGGEINYDIVVSNNKIAIMGILNGFDIENPHGCSIETYYTAESMEGTPIAFIEFTENTADFTLRYKL